MVEVGELQLTRATRIKVRVSEYRGELGVDIRKYVESPKYTGPSKGGIRLHKNALDYLINALSDKSLTEVVYDVPFARIAKSVEIDVLVQVSTFSGIPKLDIREELTTKAGSFFTKKGVSVPLNEAPKLLEMLREAQWTLEN